MVHASHFLSQADLVELFGPILNLIDAKLALLTELSKLKGRVSLVTGQIAQIVEEQDKDITENCLMYQDSGLFPSPLLYVILLCKQNYKIL